VRREAKRYKKDVLNMGTCGGRSDCGDPFVPSVTLKGILTVRRHRTMCIRPGGSLILVLS
jgi:hypothetical protein